MAPEPPSASTPTSFAGVDEARERARRVAAPADAGDDVIGDGGGQLGRALPPGLVADDALELAHHHRVGVRADDRTHAVVRLVGVGDPVAHRLAGGVLQRPAAGGHRDDLGAQQPHPEHVVRLAFHVPFAHEDLHRQPSRAPAVAVATPCMPAPVSAISRVRPMRRASNACPEHIVDLVGAGVRQVFPLEQNGHAEFGRQPHGRRQRGRPARVRRQQRGEAAAEPGIGPAWANASATAWQAGIRDSGTYRPP